MKSIFSMVCAFAVGTILFGSPTAQAAPTPTAIVVTKMHCNGCAKKIVKTLSAVPGVASVQVDLPAKRLIVTPQQQAVISPRALWEAVEKAGEMPIKLEGPNGAFDSKPQA